MNRSIHVWRLIDRSLEEKIPVMLLYVLESIGSSPGRQGFFMAINANDEMEGSIGGGMMEHKFVEMGREKLLAVSHELRAGTVRKQIHDKSAGKDQSGMICSGEQTIFLYTVQQSDAEAIKKIIEVLEQNKNAALILSQSGIELEDEFPVKDFEFIKKSDEEWLYKEKIGYKQQLTIIGGGHCSLALSRLFRQMDFYIRVYDDRKDLKTVVENDAAHEKHLVSNYTDLKNMIEPGENHYVVIMTFGYRTDDIALRAVIEKDFKYLGLLGSSTKIRKMLEEYKKEGISEKFLQRIHAPIGLPIKSQTPEEIAISIAAEIIRVKNELP
jgi:xanthine dehydrogenase accessory factor